MTIEKLKNIILDFTQDVTFDYKDKHVCINPWSMKKFEVGYGDDVRIFRSIDELFSAKYFDGKSLSEIIGEIKMTYL